MFAWGTGEQAVGDCLRGLERAVVAVVEGEVGGVGAPGLDADDADFRPHGFGGHGHPSDQTAAAYRDHQRVYFRGYF